MTSNILLVDDDELIVETYGLILESEGYEVYKAKNSSVAIQNAQNHEIDLAILDYNLPNMDGAQLGDILYKSNKDVKIIFISGNKNIKELVSKVNYSVSDTFSKPISIELLLIRINQIISSDIDIPNATDFLRPNVRLEVY